MEPTYSYGFVVLMGMGVTFFGLTAIIFLTMLLGKIMVALEKRTPQKSTATPIIPPSVDRSEPVDGCAPEVKVAILAALAQQPGFRLDQVTSVEIRKIR